MFFSRNSKIREAWQHPMGRDVLQYVMRQAGRDENWPDSPFAASARLSMLDRLAGKGFADAFVEMLNAHPQSVPPAVEQSPAWWREAVIYHIYIPSFMDGNHDGVGDLEGVLQRLPYMERLGVDALWVWPIMDDFANKMGTGDYRRVSRDAGSTEDFENLLAAAHARGMKVIIGFGLSATSESHTWFQNALKGDKIYQDYYMLQTGSGDKPPNNWGLVGSMPAWNWYPAIGKWALRLLGRRRMEINWDNPAVRSEAAEVFRFWQEKGVDGMVLGSANFISKASLEEGNAAIANLIGIRGYEHFLYGPRLNQYLRELRTEGVTSPDTVLMGEVKGFGPNLSKMISGDGEQLDMVVEATHLAMGKEGPGGREGVSLLSLKQYYLKWMREYAAKRWMPIMLETPEHPRLVSRLGASPVYRAILSKLVGTMMLTLRGTPIVYQGQELGLPNTRFTSINELHSSVAHRLYAEFSEKYGEQAALPKIIKNIPDHARTPMPWSSGPGGGFSGARPWMRLPDNVDYLNAFAQMQDKNSVWGHYHKLIALRKQYPSLVYGSFNPVFVKNDKVFCYFRIREGEKWYVEMNITEKEVARPGRIPPGMRLELSNYETQSRMLRPFEANLYRYE